MASTISSPEVPAANGRLFYCHQCSHQWRKRENSDYVCPQCREGFIEDVEEGGYAQRAAGNSEDPIYSILHRIMSDVPPRIRAGTRGTSSRSAAGRSRSRSPRAQFFVHANSRGGSTSHLNRAFFDMDDLMSSFLSTRSQPVSQRTLQGIPTLTIAQEQTDTQCSICFEEFKLAETDVRNLPCNHLFHEHCIFPWLRINGTCPVCRARLSQTDGDDANNAREAAPSSNFDNILRFMRLRRHARRHARTSEPRTSTSSSQTEESSPLPSGSSRLRVPPSITPASEDAPGMLTRARRDNIGPGSVIGRIIRQRLDRADNVLIREEPPVMSNQEEQRTLRTRLRQLYEIPPPPIIDLTASDTEAQMLSRPTIRRVLQRHPLSRSSSSSSSSSNSSNSAYSSSSADFGPLPINDNSGSDDTDFNVENILTRSPFLSSSDEE